MAKTPLFSFRLPPADRANVDEMARIYGSASSSDFAREVIRAVCSGDLAKTHAFLSKLGEKLTGQLNLEIELRVQKGIEDARRPAKVRKRRGKHERAT